MAKAETSVEELVGMIERGELRLPEMQRRYVWRSTRVRDLLDSLYRGYPSGAILVWETDEPVPMQEFAVEQQRNPYQSTRLLLDGQQRLTSLSAVIRGEPVTVRGRKRPMELLFNLDHPDQLAVVTEVNEEDGDEDEDLIEDEADSTDDELQQRFNRMTFVVGTHKLEQLPQWVKVTEVFKTDGDATFLTRAGITGFDDPRFQRYTQRLARLRSVRKYVYRMDVLERKLTYDEVTEIFVRVNSLGAKLRSSDLAWEIQEEVEKQIRDLTGLNQDAKGLYRDENVFEDADIQMAGYAAALRVLTRYLIIDGRDMTAEAIRPRVKGETTFVDGLIAFAVDTANQCLVPQGIPERHWKEYTGAERFYLKLLDLEAKGLKTLDNYQNFAKAFKVRDFRALMGNQKANEARLRSAVEFGKNELSEGSELHHSVLRASSSPSWNWPRTWTATMPWPTSRSTCRTITRTKPSASASSNSPTTSPKNSKPSAPKKPAPPASCARW